MFLAVERLIRLIEENGEDAFCRVCTKLDVPRLKPPELSFLNEYVSASREATRTGTKHSSSREQNVHGLLVANSCHASGETGDQEDVCNNVQTTDNCDD